MADENTASIGGFDLGNASDRKYSEAHAHDKIHSILAEQNAPSESEENPQETAQESEQEAVAKEGVAESEEHETNLESQEAEQDQDEAEDAEEDAIKAKDDQDDSDEGEFPVSIDELAEAIDWDEESILNLKVKTKINGQEGEAPISELLKNYQLQGNLTQEHQKVAETKKALEAQAEEYEASVGELLHKLEVADKVLDKLSESFLGDDNLDELRQTNPAEWNARKLERMEREKALAQIKQGIVGELDQLKQQEVQEQQAQFQEYLRGEMQRASEMFPELQDATKAPAFREDVKNFLMSPPFNYSEAEIQSGIVDHRQLILITDSMKLRKASEKGEVKKKKLKKLPKVMKSKSPKSHRERKQGATDKQWEKLRKSGKETHARDLIKGLII